MHKTGAGGGFGNGERRRLGTETLHLVAEGQNKSVGGVSWLSVKQTDRQAERV